ncbi:MAG: DUF4428 domain-containing protein [Solobacterium sp.]|nr:DUF4428 domain-containing protein [Solobacterium sp.]
MGLFGNLFEKKQCAICGKEIGLLGNRKLADGNMCKDCAAKLSPYFSDRRESTIADIQRQLAYREENQAKLASFNPTKVVGLNTKVYIDEAQKAFVVSRSSDFRRNNPDIIPISAVTAVDLDVRERKTEIMQEDAEGKKVSYDPKKYEYSYTFYNKIHVRCEWFDEISFEVSDSSTEADAKDSREYRFLEKAGNEVQNALMPNIYPLIEYKEEEEKEPEQTGRWRCECGAMNDPEAKFCSACGKARPAALSGWRCSCGHINTADAKFCSACGKAHEVRWFCPECGKENTGKFCSACGHERPADVTRSTPEAAPKIIRRDTEQ